MYQVALFNYKITTWNKPFLATLNSAYKNVVAKLYRNIFKRLGLTVIPVRADSGAMGGTGSEEFMVESEVGDDTLILCPKCGYAANIEKAACKPDVALDKDGNPQVATDKSVEEIPTPDVKTIDDLAAFLQTTPQAFIKTLIYKVINCGLDLSAHPSCKKLEKIDSDAGSYYPVSFVAVCIRGDLDVNETKLAALLKASEVELASDEEYLILKKQ
mgnify:CR=1 FL=1